MSTGFEFNDLLTAAGIAPSQVCAIRHQTKPGADGITLFDLWRDNPSGFMRYQETQKPDRRIFRDRKIWAGFVSPRPGETLFVGLFDASLTDTRKADWLCDYRGDQPNAGLPVDIFETRLRSELAEQIGRLQVSWPKTNVRSWSRKAEGLVLPVTSQDPRTTPSDSNVALVYGLKELGFRQPNETKKLIQLRRGNLVIYVKRETELRPLVIHPHFLDITDKLNDLGCDLEQPQRTYRNSNLTQFPIYTAAHRKTTGHHGLAVGVGIGRLPALIDLLEHNTSVETPSGLVRVVSPNDDPVTEREQLQAARVGQGKFREALLIYWNGACPVVGVDHGELLRASHIKPWKDSSNHERLDPFNGLLLCAHIDALFDRHLVSFEDDGQMLVSSSISSENRSRLGLRKDLRIDGLDLEHLPYLAHHRARFIH